MLSFPIVYDLKNRKNIEIFSNRFLVNSHVLCSRKLLDECIA